MTQIINIIINLQKWFFQVAIFFMYMFNMQSIRICQQILQ